MKTRVFLDSGAYSATVYGTVLDVYEYIDYIKQNQDNIHIYANLDVIDSEEKTWKNQRIMEAAGLKPLPVYHVNNDLKYLRRCMEYNYFAIGGMAKANATSLQYQIDEIFTIICPESNDYYPTHKLHGFSLTTPRLMSAYPWYSVDSSSWAKYGLYGMIIIPKFEKGVPVYNRPVETIVVSSRSKSIGDPSHFANQPELYKEMVTAYFAGMGIPMGSSVIFDVPDGYILQENEEWVTEERAKNKNKVERIYEAGLTNNHKFRDFANLSYYLELEKCQPEYPWQWNPKSGRLF